MAWTVADNEAPMPLIRPAICETTDNAWITTTKTVVTARVGMTDDKSKFSTKICSGALHEDLIALVVTTNQFKAWAKARGQWDAPPNYSATLLFEEWGKCLGGKASQNWLEVEDRSIGANTTPTFVLFKQCTAEFIVKKVLHDEDTWFSQNDCSMKRKMPCEMEFQEHLNALELHLAHVTWLLDAPQMIRLKNIQANFEFERLTEACHLMWLKTTANNTTTVMGQPCSNEMVMMLLNAAPSDWVWNFKMSGGSH